jgi:aminopeptidase N
MLSALAFSQNPPIEPGVSQTLAHWRAERYSDVRYKLDLTLEKMSPVLRGTIEIKVIVSPGPQASPPATATAQSSVIPPIVLDWRKIRGSENLSTISNVTINGQAAKLLERDPKANVTAEIISTDDDFEESNEHLIFRNGVVAGENVIKLDFTSPILTSGSAITRYIDKEDGSEYLYSLFVPSDASTAFPVFDQPDLKARFTVRILAPNDWKVVSDARPINIHQSEDYKQVAKDATSVTLEKSWVRIWTFNETKPISTYVFAFAAGPFHPFEEVSSFPGIVRSEVEPEPKEGNGDYHTRIRPQIFVRKSQAAKFQPHAAEVFRLTREGIKFLEEYFDYKFPFPKYDIVLIPEFPFGGMEHAGATFLRESAVIFPSEPTANDYISRATTMFHEAAHQWFGDTVTMRWFDDLWLKEGFAEFMAYKTLERVMPQYNAWKAFYERNKPAAYATDSTRGTTPIYQEIPNLSAAKSAYGNIVYRKAPSFLRQAEFYLGPDKFQTAVRAFLKKHEYANAGWEDLVKEFEAVSGSSFDDMSQAWIRQPGMWKVWMAEHPITNRPGQFYLSERTEHTLSKNSEQSMIFNVVLVDCDGRRTAKRFSLGPRRISISNQIDLTMHPCLVFPNYGDYGYGTFLLDPKSRDYVLRNIQHESDPFLRSMMWGALWDSVREAELDPREYVELAIKNLPTEKDEMIAAAVLGRVSTAMTYYVSEPPGSEPPPVRGGSTQRAIVDPSTPKPRPQPSATADGSELQFRLEAMLIDRMRSAPTLGQRVTYYRACLNVAATENARNVLKTMLRTGGNPSSSEGAPRAEADKGNDVNARTGAPQGTLPTGRVSASTSDIPLKTKDRFDIVTKLATLNDPDAPRLLADLEKTETSDDAKRYAYAAHAAFPTKENREKFWSDFVNNKGISESWIESAMGPFNSPRHSELSLPYLERALAELPNLKRNRKIFFVNGWLAAFIGGQKSKEALEIVNKFLADNPNLDLRLKVLENVDVVERAVKIRAKWAN